MATSNLMSPPARPTLHDRLMMLSSSPDLPDLKDLIAKKPKLPALRSGSAAAPIPANATKTFTSAADLRIAQANHDDQLDTIDEPQLPPAKKAPAKRARKPAKAPKRVAKEVVVLSSDGVAPNGDDETIAQIRKTAEKFSEGNTLEDKPWKRFKVPAGPGSTEGEASAQAVEAAEAAKAVKPPARTRAQRKKADKTETVSKHFAQKPAEQAKAAKASTPEPLNLETAVQRRTDWTPPRADTTPVETDPFDMSFVVFEPGEGERTTDTSETFKSLRDAYGHKTTDADSVSTNQQAATVLGKRKVIDMISVNQSSRMADDGRAPSPVKEKAPKKKPRTLTELATAAYIQKAAQPEEVTQDEDPILGYFTVDNEGQGTSKIAATKAKGKGKQTKVSKNTKKKLPPKQAILLSPEAAIRKSAGQDFIFGTSSQLAREQSPSFLKDLHTALRASNVAEDDPFATNSKRIEDQGPKKPSRGLWSVSTRDEDGKLVDAEVIDLIDSPAFPNDDKMAILDPWKNLPTEPAEGGTADSSLVELGSRPAPLNKRDSSQSPIPKSHFLSQHKVAVNGTTAASLESPSRPSHPLITDLLEEEAPPPSNQQQSQEEVRTVSTTTTNPPTQKPRPKYELFTDAKLAKEVSSFGFKAIKTRSAMIALLDQCWRSKNQGPSAGLPSFSTSSLAGSPKGKKTAPTTKSAASTSPATRKPRGRPKKTTSEVTSNASAASAREGPGSPAKKRGRPRKDAATTGKTIRSVTSPPPKPQSIILTPRREKAVARPTSAAASESEVDSAAGLSSPDQLFSSPLAVNVSISEDTEMSLTLSPTAQQSVLFSDITKAVTSAPRTTDPENPSWHEKMLMYDPIILEDLTAWLNSGELTRVGHDGEVAPADVKKWCELKSVCCLWKMNFRGKERKRF